MQIVSGVCIDIDNVEYPGMYLLKMSTQSRYFQIYLLTGQLRCGAGDHEAACVLVEAEDLRAGEDGAADGDDGRGGLVRPGPDPGHRA